jgi:hypothetical protein
MADERIASDVLGQHWVHSHEEDTDAEMVFRPASHPFPPARGRRSFELRAGGQLVEGRPGPTDRPQEAEGTWRLEADGTLTFFHTGESVPYRTLKIVSATRDRLVVGKRP